MKIGIPKALMYYTYYPLWKHFFEQLGYETVVSGNTSKIILNNGVMNCVDDACLPVKLFHGHVMDLLDKADAVFIPRLTSINPGEFICPKFIGLPEMIKSSIKGLPDVLVLDHNAYRNIKNAYKAFVDIGKKLTGSTSMAVQSLKLARISQKKYETILKQGETPLDIFETGEGHEINNVKGIIGLVGHPYLLYDQYVSMRIIAKLRNMGYRVMVPENIENTLIQEVCNRLPKKLFWSYGKKLLGSGLVMLENNMVDGLIFLSSFACGIDSFILELLHRYNQRRYRVPCTLITVDEHTGHAGFNTRLEAFIDMIEWRKAYDNNLSTYGTSVSGG